MEGVGVGGEREREVWKRGVLERSCRVYKLEREREAWRSREESVVR